MKKSNGVNTISSIFWWVISIGLIILKLTGCISWSWWVVTLPIWGPIAFGLGIAGICIALILIFGVVFMILAFAVIVCSLHKLPDIIKSAEELVEKVKNLDSKNDPKPF